MHWEDIAFIIFTCLVIIVAMVYLQGNDYE